MANTAKIYLHPNGFYFLDLGMINGERTGYAIGDTGVVRLKGDLLTDNISGCTEAFFDVFPLSKIDNAMMFATRGEQINVYEMEAVTALLNEKNEDFDGPES